MPVDLTPVWRISVPSRDLVTDLIYIWNTSDKYVPLQADWTWDEEGAIWSTGNSSRLLRLTLTYRETLLRVSNRNDDRENDHTRETNGYLRYWMWYTGYKIPDEGWTSITHSHAGNIVYWLTRVGLNRDDIPTFRLDHPASKMTRGPDGDIPHNIIKHTAVFKITFKPATPGFEQFSFYTAFKDYLNYYYLTMPYTDEGDDYPRFKENPFLTEWSKNSGLWKTLDWKGKWLLWHSSRLEDDDEWIVPVGDYDGREIPGKNYRRAAVTVLNPVPNKDLGAKALAPADRHALEGNKDKGRGMATAFGSADYAPREPVSCPMFLGPGTIEITSIADVGGFGERIDIDQLNPKVSSNSIDILPTAEDVINKAIPVQSILENFKDAHTWPETKWDTDKGLISECPFNTLTNEYYEGQIVPTIAAPYVVNEIVINPDWLTAAKESGTKCAIVFVMGYSIENLSIKHFIGQYAGNYSSVSTGYYLPKNFNMEVIVDKEHLVVEQLGEINNGKPAFAFKAGYKYIIDPETVTETPLRMVFEPHNFTATVPWVDAYYQFVAMIYRIVRSKDDDGYIIDPDHLQPVEYWEGITTRTADGGYRRLSPVNPYSSTANPSKQGEQEQTICLKVSTNKADRISTVSEFIPVNNTTHVRVTVTVPSTADDRDLPPEGSYIRFYLHDTDKGTDVWSDAMIRLPTTAGGTVSREILFMVTKYNEQTEYQVYRQLYAANGEKIGAPRAVGGRMKGSKHYLINSLTMTVTTSEFGYPVVKMSDLGMWYVPMEEKCYYSFTIRSRGVEPVQTFTTDRPEPCHPSQFTWDVPITTIQLTDSTTYDLILSIYGDAERKNLLTKYYQRYETKHYITSFTVTDVFAQKHPDEEQFLDNGDAKVQFRFYATTRLPTNDPTYKCHICLYRYKDEAIQPDVPIPDPEYVADWYFPSIDNEFDEVISEWIVLDLEHNTYRLSLQLIENAAPNATREVFYTAWETPRQAVSGWITGADKKIRIRTPFGLLNEQRIEYRMLRDGVLGTVESPWEMRTDSVIGGNTVTQPAWIVQPRPVSFRILVTAPGDLMSTALQTLVDVLASAPTKGVELQLQTTDKQHQLSIFGYIELGSPKIETREDTWAIVSVVLNCPNYAWKGHTEIIRLTGQSHMFEFVPHGHLPPSIDVWILRSGSTETQLTINGNDPLIINVPDPSYNFIHVHHNPIIQDYYIELARSLPPTIPEFTNTARPCILRRHPPLSARSILLGDETANVVETQRDFDIIQQGSFLPIILEPSQSNTIKVSGGRLVLIEYVPHYAFWW